MNAVLAKVNLRIAAPFIALAALILLARSCNLIF